MIARVVLIRLKPQHKGSADVQLVMEKTREVLPGAHGVRSLEIGVPVDPMTRRSWDLCLLVRFETAADVEIYRTDPVHRAYADVFLKPLRDRIHVYNFEMHTPAPTGGRG